ncbi:MAG: biopolymer transporter ExbD [Cyanobacteria bacterium SBLK]|nr:biopolymer transporter ExbD [Cyanobacteria bacterium SBLK]
MTQIQKKRSSPAPVKARPLKLWQDERFMQEVRIEIVPLIDVIFCILTFFILAAVDVSRQQAINLDLPKASTGTTQRREILLVSLDEFGQIYVEQQPMATRGQFYQAVENYILTKPNGLMVLSVAKETRYDEFVQVLDILREVGGDRVALATLPKSRDTEGDLPPSSLPSDVPGIPSLPEPLEERENKSFDEPVNAPSLEEN